MSERYPYTITNPNTLPFGALPLLPFRLKRKKISLEVQGLLDTGATLSVLPYEIGLQLGAVWEEQTVSLSLAGNLAHAEARFLPVKAFLGSFPPVYLAFAWTQTSNARLLLGQVNFFQSFDVRFCRSRLFFEIAPASSSSDSFSLGEPEPKS